MRRQWLALMPAAVVLVSGTQLYLEHSALSDTPFGFLVAAALWCALRVGSGTRADRAWLAVAGALLAAGVTLRPVGGFLLPVLFFWALLRHWSTRRLRLFAGLAPVLGAVIVMIPYVLVQHHATGQWSLTRTTGELVYGRVATFADCYDFTPPPGTARLCPTDPPAARPNAHWYLFNPAAPALRA